MLDRFQNFAPGLDGPADMAFAITPDDAAELAQITRGLYLGGDGTLVVEMAQGGDVTFSGCLGGTMLPLRVRKVKAATTATAIVGLA